MRLTPFLIPCLMAGLTGGCALTPPATGALSGAVSGAVSPDRLRAALRSGAVRPIGIAIADAEARYIGQVTEAELEPFGPAGRWVYEITFLPPEGAPFEVKLDASTGELIEAEGVVRKRER